MPYIEGYVLQAQNFVCIFTNNNYGQALFVALVFCYVIGYRNELVTKPIPNYGNPLKSLSSEEDLFSVSAEIGNPGK